MKNIQVSLNYHSPLLTTIQAIRTCWDSHCRSDSTETQLGPNDINLLRNTILKYKHFSTIEHIVYSFRINGISRLCLQELARHRLASYSVKSARYTLKELKTADLNNEDVVYKYIVKSPSEEVNSINTERLFQLKHFLNENLPQDTVKYAVPECYRTNLFFTINARSLRNFLELRLSKGAHFEIRHLASLIAELIPVSHRILFDDIINFETP